MDEVLFALIESEREADEAFEGMSDAELAPVAEVIDEDGARIRIHADGTYAAFGSDGQLLKRLLGE